MGRTRHRSPVPPRRRSPRWPRAAATALAALSLTLVGVVGAGGAGAPAARAAEAITLEDGVTAPVYDYADAIRERVFIPVAGVDQDLDGADDVTRIEIIRPRASDGALRVPAIIDPSPYYTTLGRGNEGEFISDGDGDGLNDTWPLYYDNYFVPRGYAVILAEMDGTAGSTGCPMHGGPGDIASMKVVIDWLQGRVAGYDAVGTPVTAGWHNGKAAMIGKSYDGTLANGVAATGVEGLTTIVPISAISNWYGYSRAGGIRFNTNYPSGLANTVTNPARRAACAATRLLLNNLDGDESGDVNAFWAERDYRASIAQLHASVFLVHGLNDDNVRMSQAASYWDALVERDVPRKIWLAKVGHTDPFDFRRAEWVDTLHRWFDHWLLGVENGIMDEPQATVETAPEQYEDVASWPVPGTEPVELYLGATEPGAAGALRLQPAATPATLSFTGPATSISELNAINAPTGSQAQRLAFLSEPLAAELRLSGTPRVELVASIGGTQANLSALLVDYGPSTRTPRTAEGVQNAATTSCWGAESPADDACYLDVARRTADVAQWRIATGGLDTSNRDSIVEGEATPVVAGAPHTFSWPLEPYDTVIAAGHRIGVIVTTNLAGLNLGGAASASVAVDAAASRIVLPVVGGLAAAAVAGGLGAPAPVHLDFDLGGHGGAIDGQPVAYGATPTAPAAPAEDGWVFGGWFADAAATTPFDFGTPLTADAVAYAKWTALVDAVATIELAPSATTVDQGGSIMIGVQGFDAGGAPLGDVGPLAVITSSIASDVIVGGTVTFPHASPHVLSVQVGAASAELTVEVVPTAVDPVEPVDPTDPSDPDPTDPTDPSDPTDPDPGTGSAPAGGATGSTGSGTLASSGIEAAPVSTLAVLLLAGGALLIPRRRRA